MKLVNLYTFPTLGNTVITETGVTHDLGQKRIYTDTCPACRTLRVASTCPSCGPFMGHYPALLVATIAKDFGDDRIAVRAWHTGLCDEDDGHKLIIEVMVNGEVLFFFPEYTAGPAYFTDLGPQSGCFFAKICRDVLFFLPEHYTERQNQFIESKLGNAARVWTEREFLAQFVI